MNPAATKKTRCGRHEVETHLSEILILPDGRIFAHNLTPEMARVLADLNPADAAMGRRARRNKFVGESAKSCWLDFSH